MFRNRKSVFMLGLRVHLAGVVKQEIARCGSRLAALGLMALVGPRRVPVDEPGLVCEYDRLDAVAEVEFLPP